MKERLQPWRTDINQDLHAGVTADLKRRGLSQHELTERLFKLYLWADTDLRTMMLDDHDLLTPQGKAALARSLLKRWIKPPPPAR